MPDLAIVSRETIRGRAVQFTPEGGIFTLAMQERGLWEVRIPWQVAIDALSADGALTTDRGALRQWLASNTGLFSTMVIARIDGTLAEGCPDDRRVTIVRLHDRRNPDPAASSAD